MRKFHVLLIMLALLLAGTNAWAQGFGVYEHGACTMGRGGASVASPCNDGSSIFFNPAGLTLFDTTVISLGTTAINPVGGFTNATTNVVANLNNKYYPVPSGYFVTPLNKKVSIGVGMFAPYGLTTDWPVYPNAFEGRFLGYKTSLQGVYIQPTMAIKVNDKLSIGGGVDISRVYLELNQRVDLSTVAITGTPYTFATVAGVPAGTDFANVTMSGHHFQAGYHLGFLTQVNDQVSFGARYMSRQKVSVSDADFRAWQIPSACPSGPCKLLVPLGATLPAGTPVDMIVRSQFTGTGPLATQKASTSLTLPDQLVFGTAIKFNRKTTLFVDYQFTHWALFDKLVIIRENVPGTPITNVENYQNTHGIRFGVEHELNKSIVVRGGFLTHTAAAPADTVTPLLPEGPRKEVSMGFGVKAASHMRVDFAYMYLHQADRAGRTVPGTAANNNGTYNFMSHLFSTSLSFDF